MPKAFLVRIAVIASALITIGVGVWIYLDTDKVIGAILVGFGVLDLLTMPLVMRMVARQSSETENPYARED